MSTSPVRSPRETAELLLRTVVEGERSALADLYAPDAKITNMWAPGGPDTTEGREVIRARMAGAADLWDFESADVIGLHETADAEVVVLEYRVGGRIRGNGTEFSLGFVSVLRVVDGLITDARDYSNPEETSALLPLLQAASAG
jgi:ketosteroid isomerase-like protein